MDFSHLLKTSLPQEEKLIDFGFQKDGENFLLKKALDSDFYAKITLTKTSLTAQTIEIQTEEKYALLDVKTANGSFVGELRQKLTNLINQIKDECFITTDLRERYTAWLEKEFNTKGDSPWDSDPEYEVFRCPNNKWFALIMKIPFNRLGAETEEKVNVVNLKAENIPDLVDNRSVFPAWHMNKKYWITVLLTSVTDFEKLCTLTKKSAEIVQKKK